MLYTTTHPIYKGTPSIIIYIHMHSRYSYTVHSCEVEYSCIRNCAHLILRQFTLWWWRWPSGGTPGATPASKGQSSPISVCVYIIYAHNQTLDNTISVEDCTTIP